jgi:hypothetical protein
MSFEPASIDEAPRFEIVKAPPEEVMFKAPAD